MPNSVYPVAVTSGSSPAAKSVTCVSSNTLYSGTSGFEPGTYTVTCISSSVASYNFLNGNTSVTSGSTVSGTVTVNLASPATRVLVSTNTGSNVIVTITLIAGTIAPVSGTVETITTSGNYDQSGAAYVVAVGGGKGGSAQAGPGGTGGSIAGAFFSLDGTPKSVVIGAGGAGQYFNSNQPGSNSPVGSGGSTSFGGNLIALGGGAGGSPGNSPYPFVISGSNGNGGNVDGSPGNGSGIGTGGNFSAPYNGNAGSGYGAGGGAANSRGGGNPVSGGPGSQGAVFLIRL
jgi:hypothetical protein